MQTSDMAFVKLSVLNPVIIYQTSQLPDDGAYDNLHLFATIIMNIQVVAKSLKPWITYLFRKFVFLFFCRDLTGNLIARILRVHFADCPLSSNIYLGSNDITYIEDGSFAHVTSTGEM